MLEESIRTYANLMKELGLSALEIKEDNCTLRLERNQGIAEPAPAAPAAAPAVTAAPEVRAGSGDIEVISPMVGVFYAAPAENTAPYVRKGSRVKKGDTLCIIEAMKLMNE
ncbi:MAG: acetyl-CoA carboxylase, biotin carboxyl carrier protein, partial [Oscillospiraceae bacterium]|nr:acetyl-CoA carboxylase, biotin carboxyl carrier protein [Oscillospiraceae bacterium]